MANYVVKQRDKATDAARYFGVTAETVRRWVAAGYIHGEAGPDGDLLVNRALDMRTEPRLWRAVVRELVDEHTEATLTAMLRQWQAEQTAGLRTAYRDTTVRRWARGTRVPRPAERRWLWGQWVELKR